MVLLSLQCAVVGEVGTSFDVDIDDRAKASTLKDAIKEKNSSTITCDAKDLLLFLAKKGKRWLTEDEAATVRLDERGHLQGFEMMKSSLFLKNTKHFGSNFQGDEDEVHVLVVVPKQEVSAYQPQIFPPFRPNADGLNLEMPHLSRDALVQKLYNNIADTNIVLLSSPAGSGKTSLLTMFARRYSDFNYITIAFHDFKADATALIDMHGVDLVNKRCRLPDDKLWIFMLDDCQQQYQDVAFWTQLIKGTASWLPKHVRFIISATHMLETDFPESPVEFDSISWKLTRDDFLISDVEAYECLALENGLPTLLRFPTLLEVIIRECNGHIGSLRVSINAIYAQFRPGKGHDPTEQESLEYFFSGTFVSQMARCFGSKHTTPASPNQQKFLSRCLLCDTSCQPLVQQLSPAENQCFTRLKKSGIVTEVDGYVKFTSPLAERYYYKWLFPGRGNENPTSLHELIRKAIGSMSASALKQSVVRNDDFPKEAVFQHQFMATLARHTTSTCYICPELSRVFPASPLQPSTRIDGEIDFYLNGSLRWGIELLVNGAKIGEHLSRFGTQGKYAALAAKDYAIIDFRGNKRGITTCVKREPEKITVFFKLGDFSTCHCIFGLVRDQEPIILNH